MKPIAGLIACFSLCAGLSSPIAMSETVTIPLGKQGDYWNVERPKTGISKDQVLARYGEPLSRTGPVGNPPITTWQYEQFKVYFEYEHVIHSVVLPNK